MDLSGIIFVALAVAWAFYLIPKAVKHHDDVARSHSVDRFSNAMRVLARREPVDDSNARVVVAPPRTADRVLVPSHRPAPSAVARRAAARAAARRRRHVLLVLVIADLAVTGVAAFALVPWWSVAVPVALTGLYLFACRRQVRRENEAFWDSAPVATEEASERASGAPRRAIRLDTPAGRSTGTTQPAEAAHSAEVLLADEDTVQIPVEQLETVAVSVETEDGGSLWDPLPVTLPTYVGKARAPRSVRTIDLEAPGTWTSGRDEADSALVEQASSDEVGESTGQQAKAVGS